MEYLHENNSFVITNKKGEEDVSTACILLFGKNPQKFFPRARTRFIKYEGIDEKVGAEMNVIKDVTFEGTILNQVKKTIEFIEAQVREHTFLGLHGQFVTLREYPKLVKQEMTVNACCHRAYSIKGTEIQIKMFDDQLVFESPGKLPGMVKPANIRYTHFSRNPKIAAFLKAYHYVKEFGEGLDRICREQEANGAKTPSFRTDEFILKITVPKVTEKVYAKGEKVKVNVNVTEKVNVNDGKVIEKVIEKHQKVIEKLIEKAAQQSKREQTETCFQYAEREYLRRSQKSIGSKAQKFKGSSGQNCPIAINTDAITIAKHKNGRYYLRVIFNNFGHSEIFFLSKEETHDYLLAADAMERERLKQLFAFKYLLRASGGSHDQNREWEVGNGYDDDNGRGLKR